MKFQALPWFFAAVVFAKITDIPAQAFRRCINKCSNKPEDPVCGSDGITYNNGCMLSWTACRTRTTILMVHAGACDPCTNHKCTTPPNSRCKAINGVASCVCSYKCHRSNKKVCGSNGKTYANECEMQKHSCSLNTTITVNKRGECRNSGSSTGCAALSCPGTTICRVIAGRARCIRKRRCRRFCPRTYRPVCATNGRTYSSQCVLDRLACRYHKDIAKSYDGRCRVVHRRCIGKICPRGEICKMIRRRPKCTRVCPKGCPRIYRPVCGTDGNTYSNECSLRLEACRRKAVIKVSSPGKCKTSSGECNANKCKPPLVCKVISGRATCVRKVCRSVCPRLYRPVCGTDKKTYPNECELQKTACRSNKNTKIDHEGRCEVVVSSSCKFKTCVFRPYSTCKVIKNIPKCVCQANCPRIRRPVCGTDKKTYNNVCLLKLRACNTTARINIAHKGPCKAIDTCGTKNCSGSPYSVCKMIRTKPTCVFRHRCSKAYKPVCGSDNKTYHNLCLMQRKAYRTKTLITLKNNRRCQDKETCPSKPCNFYGICHQRRGRSFCICPSRKTCLRIKNKFSPVCGSDGVTYINNCTMKIMSCEKKKKVGVVSLDRCPGTCKLGSKCDPRPYSTCSSRTGAFTCVCPKFCTSKYEPVCGSDGRVYGNMCTLKEVACDSNRTITPTNFTKCASNHSCANVFCRKKLHCKDIDGQPRCVSRRCWRCRRIDRPVCGSDGKTYANECELRRKACLKNSRVKRARNGPCETKAQGQCQIGSPCSSPPNSICSNMTGVPSCVCPRFCTFEYNPVCGTDGLIYDNHCQMRVTACTLNRTIAQTDYTKCGACKLGTRCSSPPNSMCRRVYSKSRCVCPLSCPKISSPVCGSDGKRYDNMCLMEKTACEQNKIINQTDLSKCGQCQIGSPCSSPPNSICSNMAGVPSCVCPMFCTFEYNPVCGTDGKTYPNPCVMRVTACNQNKPIAQTDFSKCGQSREP